VPAQVGQTNGSCTVTSTLLPQRPVTWSIPSGGQLDCHRHGGGQAATRPLRVHLQSARSCAFGEQEFQFGHHMGRAASQLTINIVGTDPNNALTQLSLTDALPAAW